MPVQRSPWTGHHAGMAEGQQPARVGSALVCLGGSASAAGAMVSPMLRHVAQVFSKSLICPHWLDKE